MEDKTLVCKECGHQFAFSARDQEFYAEKGFTNEPARCRECRLARKAQTASGAGGAARPSFATVCAQCGAETTVPFLPRGDRPIYCRTCYAAQIPVATH